MQEGGEEGRTENEKRKVLFFKNIYKLHVLNDAALEKTSAQTSTGVFNAILESSTMCHRL